MTDWRVVDDSYRAQRVIKSTQRVILPTQINRLPVGGTVSKIVCEDQIYRTSYGGFSSEMV